MRENIKKDFGLGGGGVQGFRAQLTFHFSLWVDDHSSVVCTDQMGGGGSTIRMAPDLHQKMEI